MLQHKDMRGFNTSLVSNIYLPLGLNCNKIEVSICRLSVIFFPLHKSIQLSFWFSSGHPRLHTPPQWFGATSGGFGSLFWEALHQPMTGYKRLSHAGWSDKLLVLLFSPAVIRAHITSHIHVCLILSSLATIPQVPQRERGDRIMDLEKHELTNGHG